ncbi:MAG: PDZ domain-containing protein, partial [Myxococcota bacterium]
AAVAWVLDAELRDRSGGYATLDDAMRLAYSRHSRESGFTSQQFQAACEDAANLGPGGLADFFDNYVRGTTDIDTTTALRVFGLTMGEDSDTAADPQAWLGAETSGTSTVRVPRVIEGGPAWNADLLVGDEIIAIDQHRVPEGGLEDLVGRFEPNTEVTLTIARRGLLREAKVTLAEAKSDNRYTLGVNASASIEARETRKQWLMGSQTPIPTAE